MNIDNLTIGEAKELAKSFGKLPSEGNSVWEVGKAYLIRTVTNYYTGKLEVVTDKELLLSNCAWVVDTGRFFDCLKNGTVSEIEPIPGNVIVGRGAVVDAIEWTHELPSVQK